MAQIILKNQKLPINLVKKISTFGCEAFHDFQIQTDKAGILFSLQEEAGRYFLQPNAGKVYVNEQVAQPKLPLENCDRISWSKGSAIFVDTDLSMQTEPAAIDALSSLRILQNLASALQLEGGSKLAVEKAFQGVLEIAEAEEGYLLVEKNSSAWEIIATNIESQENRQRKILLSNTILQEALTKRSPLYIESIIGHPHADAASVIAARVFSVACFPLIVNDKIIGALFLSTKTPGRSIQKRRFTELNLLATQMALLLSIDRSPRKMELPELNLLCEEASSPMLSLKEKVRKLAQTPMHILVQGETGTGKELVARAIHTASSLSSAPFVAINCAAIPATLLESTLFGFERGAFTGAEKSQKGKFLQADGGTLFLDEIGDLPLELQAKLLRVLQDGLVEPIGATRAVKVNLRIVSATHQNLDAMVKAKSFRQDLYFRLTGAKLLIPALRERKMDIPILANHFLAKAAPQKSFSPQALAVLDSYPWPGNVRELEQVVTRAGYMSGGVEILESDLELEKNLSLPEDNDLFWENFSSLDAAQLAFTRSLVEKTLQKTQGNRLQAASRLGISERTLYRILQN